MLSRNRRRRNLRLPAQLIRQAHNHARAQGVEGLDDGKIAGRNLLAEQRAFREQRCGALVDIRLLGLPEKFIALCSALKSLDGRTDPGDDGFKVRSGSFLTRGDRKSTRLNS